MTNSEKEIEKRNEKAGEEITQVAKRKRRRWASHFILAHTNYSQLFENTFAAFY